MQKSAVTPLTRQASRSVMGTTTKSLHVEGPAATFDPRLTELQIKLLVGLMFFWAGIIGLAQQGAMKTSQRSRTTPERPCP